MELGESGIDPASMLWQLEHEKLRHQKDIDAIQVDIDALRSQGVTIPDEFPPLDTFIEVNGVDYGGRK